MSHMVVLTTEGEDSRERLDRKHANDDRAGASPKAAMAILEHRERQLRAVFEEVREAVIFSDPDGENLEWNPAARKLVGLGSGDKEPKSLRRLSDIIRFQTVTGEEIESERWPVQRLMRGEYLKDEDWMIQRPDGSAVPVMCNAGALRDRNGINIGLLITWRHMDELKQIQGAPQETHRISEKRVEDQSAESALTKQALKKESAARASAEKELSRYMKELQRSNRELQDFAFVASHDLQEPLRKVETFASLLEEEYGVNTKGDALAYIHRMKDAAGRMRELIDRLLEYSRVNSGKAPLQTVDLGKVVQEVVSDIETYIEQEGGCVEVGVNAIIEADAFQMRQLFQNLIHNAVKFRGDNAPVVKISGSLQKTPAGRASEKEVEVAEIFVQDNGIGFDEVNMDKVFAPFQRLHPVHKYKGTGMGLPICKKIIERHHGELTARSEVGRGAVFIVRLPAAQPHAQYANGAAMTPH